jgi:membrane fusion protein (multidrug efflux system)
MLKEDFMETIEFQQDGATESQGKSERTAAPHATGQETHIAPTQEAPGLTPSTPIVSALDQSRPASRPPAKHRRIAAAIIVLVVFCGLVIGFLPRWHQRRVATSDMSQLSIPTVSVASLTPLKSGGGLILPAEIRPWREASIFARANGYLKDWVADIGARVQEGQLLAEIETPDLDQQLEQSKAQLVLAQANLHLAETTDARWRELLKTSSVSEQAAAEKAAGREVAAASVAAAQADVRRLQELVAFQRVVAPFAGTITIRAVDIGDLIVAGSGGSQLFHLAQTDKLRVYVRVPEPDALSIMPGQEANLTTPENPGREFIAKVVTTSQAISTTSRTLLTELEVDNAQNQVLPYSYGEITFKAVNTDPPLTLPSDTLLFRAQGLQVGVVRPDGTVELRSVQVGRDFGNTIEIRGGVTPADRVITNPTDSLVDGARVRIEAVTNTVAAR